MEGGRKGGSGFKRWKGSASVRSDRTEDRTTTACAKVSFYLTAVQGWG